ncbi:hypothetical protein [Streptomyces sp. NPDC002845]
MSDFQDWSPASAGPGGGGGPDGGSVDQIVFRWDGNQGRQGTGMKAVAHSCPAERAEELGRELGPLLWVSGTGAARPSVVRVLSRDGAVMLVQRRPTTDRSGRPSTVSHVLVGDPGTLKTRQCLALSYGGWGRQESAETATGEQDMVECATLDALARSRLPDMLKRLPEVEHALILVTAEWLRDPTQHVSLLTEEKAQPGWPDRDRAPLLYLGLFLLFGPWLNQEWTFATYDTVDTHPLRLTCVPHWEPDTGGSAPLARLMNRTPASPRFEHRAAARLVEHLLAHPGNGRPGVPQLLHDLPNGATLPWQRRSALLKQILSPDRRPATAPTPERTEATSTQHTEPHGEGPPKPHPQPHPHSNTHPEPHSERHPAPYPHPSPSPSPSPYPSPHPEPAPRTSPPTAPPPTPPHPHPPLAHEPYTLHRDLCRHQRGNGMQHSLLVAQLRELPDDVLLRELRTGELPPASVDLLLNELGNQDRVQLRHPDMQHELCAEMLRNNLYFTPYGQSAEPVSRTAMANRAADIFAWAVAPLARDERYLLDLRELLHRMSLDRDPAAGNWLQQSIITPAHRQAPDLPPVIWQQLLRDLLSKTDRPPSPPQTPTASPNTPTTAGPEPPTFGSRLSEQLNNPGCVIGAAFGLITAVLITIVLLFV